LLFYEHSLVMLDLMLYVVKHFFQVDRILGESIEYDIIIKDVLLNFRVGVGIA